MLWAGRLPWLLALPLKRLVCAPFLLASSPPRANPESHQQVLSTWPACESSGSAYPSQRANVRHAQTLGEEGARWAIKVESELLDSASRLSLQPRVFSPTVRQPSSQLFSFVCCIQVELVAVVAMASKDSKDMAGTAQPVPSNLSNDIAAVPTEEHEVKKPWWSGFKEPGSALQIISAAALAIAIGVVVATQVDEVPEAARVIISIPGDLWLRSLKAVVLPLIVCSMLLAVTRLREMSNGGSLLAKWTVGYYIITTLISISLSCIMMGAVWTHQYQVVDEESLKVDNDDDSLPDTSERPIHTVVLEMFQSFIPANVVSALANDELLAVIITAILVGYLIEDPRSPIIRVTEEIERMITKIITFLIKVAPIGVFFLILPNLMKLDIGQIGLNLGLLIGATLSTMLIHILIIVPMIFFAFTRMNAYAYWLKISPAWVTAWGSASSAATLSVTLRCAKARGIPSTIYKFTCPLGCLINMDGTAIYLPAAVVFLAATQGITLGPADYVIVALLSTLASIGVSPIPSASLVLSIMIARSVNVELTGMYGVIVAIDWFLDRFRTAVNVSGDLFASMIIYKMTGIEDPPEAVEQEAQEADEREKDASNKV
ncbi:excitatory amino acid transporter [Fusarium albosuccineum]|uniref:Amino acid transporter n=1 Tax=Fusarium albosuccineum TaxID=1237068 RepID=A0A8H4P6U4_9HYPO|nr:excitatory amino acid transporter [Fusarium albosuccineum]